MVSSISATGGDSRLSRSSKKRPLINGMPIVLKYEDPEYQILPHGIISSGAVTRPSISKLALERSPLIGRLEQTPADSTPDSADVRSSTCWKKPSICSGF